MHRDVAFDWTRKNEEVFGVGFKHQKDKDRRRKSTPPRAIPKYTLHTRLLQDARKQTPKDNNADFVMCKPSLGLRAVNNMLSTALNIVLCILRTKSPQLTDLQRVTSDTRFEDHEVNKMLPVRIQQVAPIPMLWMHTLQTGDSIHFTLLLQQLEPRVPCLFSRLCTIVYSQLDYRQRANQYAAAQTDERYQ